MKASARRLLTAIGAGVVTMGIAPRLLAAEGHPDPVAPVILAIAVLLILAKLGGHIAVRLGQPAVLGELIAGVALGSIELLGYGGLAFIKTDPVVDVLARIGVVLLLFEVGLESTIRDMLKVGLPSLAVAALGVAAPFALGWLVGALLLPAEGTAAHAFLGATLTATSVGITARVLRDLGESQSPTGRVILGAAVFDDVLGLVILAVVSGAIAAADSGAGFSYSQIGLIVAEAAVFLAGSLALGVLVTPRLFRLTARLRGGGVQITTALVFCFALAYAANAIGLAVIVGAYAAGLILEPAHFHPFTERGEAAIDELIQPISAFLVPVFFVLMGARVELHALARPDVLGLALLLTIGAVIGKQVCSLGAFGQGLDRLSVGIGMVPRGEVGLIFANIGQTLTVRGQRVIDEAVFSAVVIMVIVTTMVTPPALKWSLSRRERHGR